MLENSYLKVPKFHIFSRRHAPDLLVWSALHTVFTHSCNTLSAHPTLFCQSQPCGVTNTKYAKPHVKCTVYNYIYWIGYRYRPISAAFYWLSQYWLIVVSVHLYLCYIRCQFPLLQFAFRVSVHRLT